MQISFIYPFQACLVHNCIVFVLFVHKWPIKCYVMQMWVGVSNFLVKKRYEGSTLLALRGGGWGSNFPKKMLLNTSMTPYLCLFDFVGPVDEEKQRSMLGPAKGCRVHQQSDKIHE